LEARFGVSNLDGGVEVGIHGVSVERCFIFVWAAHAQSGADPLRVALAFDPSEDRQLGVVPGKSRWADRSAHFQAAEERFGHSVVIAVTD